MERNIIPIVAAPKVEGTQTTEHATARSVHLTGAGASFCRAHTDCCGGLLQPSAKALWCSTWVVLRTTFIIFLPATQLFPP